MPHFICFIPCICFQLPLYVLEEICKSSINATSISIMLNIKVHLWICYGILHAIRNMRVRLNEDMLLQACTHSYSWMQLESPSTSHMSTDNISG
uniref:Uncharacterized protein n=1 Tax=Populus trichocarpa TaxID=3694 RepID=A0A2K2BIJ5_POPTR